VRRNALSAALFRVAEPRNDMPVALTPEQAVDWINSITHEPARHFRYGEVRVGNGYQTAGSPRRSLQTRPLVDI
jgi:hypothetical protein